MTPATFLEGPMCRTMGKAGKLLPIHPQGPIKLERLPIPSWKLWNKRAGFFLLQTCKALLRELQLGSVKCAPVLHLNMPCLLHYFLSDPVGYSDYGPCHHFEFFKLNLSVKPRLDANLCSSHLRLPSAGITGILSPPLQPDPRWRLLAQGHAGCWAALRCKLFSPGHFCLCN